MNKISLIIKREYLTRVKKKSFIIMTILGPILMAAMMIVPIYMATRTEGIKVIAVKDDTNMFKGNLTESENIKFVNVVESLDLLKKEFYDKGYYAVLWIPQPSDKSVTYAELFSRKDISLPVQDYIKEQVRKESEINALLGNGIDYKIIENSKLPVQIKQTVWKDDGTDESRDPVVSTFVGLFLGIMIYFFIFMFGAQVMRGVIEEKTSRIIEVIISSVKPFQLMMGKIIGLALVGLTQFLLWVVLTGALYGIFMASVAPTLQSYDKQRINTTQNIEHVPINLNDAQKIKTENQQTFKVKEVISKIPFGTIIPLFIFYFLFGYLLYAALFAAVGSAVDNDADTQQFMLPITVPLILPIMMSSYIASNPDAPFSVWLSIIPFTSPITMMIRSAFEVNLWTELIPSMVLLFLTFLGTTWFAGKVYRTGILMYGKKASYKELWKWVRYK